ncbi:TonB-dependent receptor [Blastomonas sp.]|uniref:TonB-dependent receptor n=1 Tax=Blastomonas sp. TaxID=1909299 RepID=UPI003594449C
MHSTATISLIAATIMAQSQDDATDAQRIVQPTDQTEIVVTATRSGSAIEQLPISVSVVDEEAVNAQLRQNRNILSGLEFIVPGLSVQDSEVRGSCSSAIRGRAASFQINGVPVNEDLRPGSCTGPFTISPFSVERVEVVRGGTALYGSGAPGGIINLITRRAKSEALEIDATLQTSFNTQESRNTFTTDLYAGVGQKVGAFDYYVGAAYTDGGRVRSASGLPVLSADFEAIDVLTSFGLDLGAGQDLRFTGTFHNEDVGPQFFPDGTIDPVTGLSRIVEVAPHPQVGQGRDRNVTMALSYHHPALLAHDVTFSLFYQDQSIKQRDNFFSADFGNDFFASNRENSRFGFRSALTRSYLLGSGSFKTTYGFDFTRNDFLRFNVDPADGERVTGYVTPAFYLNTYAPFVQVELGLGRLTLTGGVRREWYRGAIEEEGFDPALPRAATPGAFGKSSLNLWNAGAVYAVADAIQLYASFSQGAELTQLGRAARGALDPSLISVEPASSDQYEIGIRGDVDPVNFGMALYHSRSASSSQIQPDPSCAGEIFCPLIPLRVPERFRGFEANASWRATENFTLSGVFTVQRGRVFNEDLGRFIAYGTDVAVPLRVTGRAEWSPVDPVKVNFQMTHYGASSFFSPTEQAIGFIDTDAVTLASGSVSYRLGSAEFYIAADNLFDKRYVSVANQVQGQGGFTFMEAPGRRVTLGVSGRF